MSDFLCHHGIKGQKWGVRRFQNHDGTLTEEGKKRRSENGVFVSGSWRISDEKSGYYRKELPKEIRKELDDYISKGRRILVGDAPGIDSMTQDYLAKKKYKKVDIYVTGSEVRKNGDTGKLGWKVHNIDGSMYPEGGKEWHAVKDEAMTRDSKSGLAVILPNGGAGATRKNVKRLVSQNKSVKVFELKDKYSSNLEDGWRIINEVLNEPD